MNNLELFEVFQDCLEAFLFLFVCIPNYTGVVFDHFWVALGCSFNQDIVTDWEELILAWRVMLSDAIADRVLVW